MRAKKEIAAMSLLCWWSRIGHLESEVTENYNLASMYYGIRISTGMLTHIIGRIHARRRHKRTTE